MIPDNLRALHPVPPTLAASECVACGQAVARWAIRGGTPPAYICASCMLRKTPWGEGNASTINQAKIRIEEARGRTLDLQTVDADDVLGFLVLMDRALTSVSK